MTPIFGEGVVFDAPPERAPGDAPQPGAARQVHARPRRDHRGRGRPDGRRLGRRGRDRPARLVRRADDLHVVGLPDRQARSASSSTAASPQLYHDLERGTDALAYVDPYADIESFRAPRRGARRRSSSWCRRSWTSRDARARPPTEDRDLLDVLMSIKDEDGSPHFSADIITGMFISMMFAGHHTTLRHRGVDADRAAAPPRRDGRRRRRARRRCTPTGRTCRYQALREIPRLEAAIKEALRLHPPLILLLRVAKEEIELGGHTIPAGTMVGASPRGVEPDRRGLPRAGALRPGALPRPAPGGPRQPRGPGSRSAPAGTAASAPRSR